MTITNTKNPIMVSTRKGIIKAIPITFDELRKSNVMNYFRQDPNVYVPSTVTPFEQPKPKPLRNEFANAVKWHDHIQSGGPNPQQEPGKPYTEETQRPKTQHARQVKDLYAHVDGLVRRHKLHDEKVDMTGEGGMEPIKNVMRDAHSAIGRGNEHYKNGRMIAAYGGYDTALWNLHRILENQYGNEHYRSDWHNDKSPLYSKPEGI